MTTYRMFCSVNQRLLKEKIRPDYVLSSPERARHCRVCVCVMSTAAVRHPIEMHDTQRETGSNMITTKEVRLPRQVVARSRDTATRSARHMRPGWARPHRASHISVRTMNAGAHHVSPYRSCKRTCLPSPGTGGPCGSLGLH